MKSIKIKFDKLQKLFLSNEDTTESFVELLSELIYNNLITSDTNEIRAII